MYLAIIIVYTLVLIYTLIESRDHWKVIVLEQALDVISKR